MDVNYHYFTVKTLADLAGFSDADTQCIASYSQFVDDYDIYASIIIDSVPDFAQYLATKRGRNWKFTPVTTGFNTIFHMARLLRLRNQLAITVPFHFIPQRQYANQVADRSEYRTVPASMSTPSLMQSMLVDVRTEYVENQDNEPIRKLCLMKIGLLLHTFADTYAHQNFSGLHGWENHAELTKAQNLIPEPDEDVLCNYRAGIIHLRPSIGHANLDHAPDETNIELGWSQKANKGDSNYSSHYQRSNIREFCTVSYEIVNYLLSCRGMPSISDSDWNTFLPNLVVGFKATQKDIDFLCKHWHDIFPNIAYRYDKKSMLNSILTVVNAPNGDDDSMLLNSIYAENGEPLEEVSANILFTTKSDDFFHYNVFADQIRSRVNGLDNEANFETYLSDMETENAKLSEGE